jgi:hypothetical protein
MPTIAAGTSATVTLNAGRSFEFTAGSGSASMFLPGAAVGQPYTLTAPGALGPFADTRTLYVTARETLTYSTDGPAGPDGLTDAQVAGITASVVGADGASKSRDFNILPFLTKGPLEGAGSGTSWQTAAAGASGQTWQVQTVGECEFDAIQIGVYNADAVSVAGITMTAIPLYITIIYFILIIFC